MDLINFDFDTMKPKKLFINCFIHGQQTEAMINGKCKPCREKEISDEQNKQYENMILCKKRDSGVMELYLNASLSNYQTTHEKQAKLLELLLSYEFNQDIVLLGKTGTGKTHLACALIDKAIRQSISAHYVPYYHLAKLQIREAKKFEKMMNAKFLVIDEYGMSESDYKSNLLSEIWNDRNGMGRVTALISNYSPLDIQPNFNEKGEPVGVSHALYSRMKSNSIYYACDWGDYRLKGKNNEFNK